MMARPLALLIGFTAALMAATASAQDGSAGTSSSTTEPIEIPPITISSDVGPQADPARPPALVTIESTAQSLEVALYPIWVSMPSLAAIRYTCRTPCTVAANIGTHRVISRSSTSGARVARVVFTDSNPRLRIRPPRSLLLPAVGMISGALIMGGALSVAFYFGGPVPTSAYPAIIGSAIVIAIVSAGLFIAGSSQLPGRRGGVEPASGARLVASRNPRFSVDAAPLPGGAIATFAATF